MKEFNEDNSLLNNCYNNNRELSFSTIPEKWYYKQQLSTIEEKVSSNRFSTLLKDSLANNKENINQN